MRRIFIADIRTLVHACWLSAAIALCAPSLASAQTGAMPPEDQAVLAPIRALFDGMSKRDPAAIKAPTLAGGTMVLMREGKPVQMGFEAFAERVGKPDNTQIEERIHDPLVRIDNDLAVVWAPFDFLIDGKVDHCGTDLFNLIRVDGKWMIASVADTGAKNCSGKSVDTAAVQQDVRSFLAAVARDVTQEGPIAWSRYFEDTPPFFMAVNGQVAFSSGEAAKQGIPQVARSFKRIQLEWGADPRIDPLTREFAVVGAPWREVLTDSADHTVTQTGYFSAVAEYHDRRWQFRNVHWSSPVSQSQ
jgi:hypothetical protein